MCLTDNPISHGLPRTQKVTGRKWQWPKLLSKSPQDRSAKCRQEASSCRNSWTHHRVTQAPGDMLPTSPARLTFYCQLTRYLWGGIWILGKSHETTKCHIYTLSCHFCTPQPSLQSHDLKRPSSFSHYKWSICCRQWAVRGAPAMQVDDKKLMGLKKLIDIGLLP